MGGGSERSAVGIESSESFASEHDFVLALSTVTERYRRTAHTQNKDTLLFFSPILYLYKDYIFEWKKGLKMKTDLMIKVEVW